MLAFAAVIFYNTPIKSS